MMKMTLAYGLILAAVFVFWYALGYPHQVKEPDLPDGQKLQSISYAPFEKDQSPLDAGLKGPTISEQRIDTDLAILSRRFAGIRTYSITGLEAVPFYAEKHGLKVLLGAWVSGDPLATQQELTKVIDVARRYPSTVRGIVVGNEALLRRDVSASLLVEYIHQVKTALPNIPVTYADVWEFWLKHPEVAPATDFVLIHILPYWEDKPVSIGQAIAHVQKIREYVIQKIPDKEIVIGETGWPSQGRMREGSLPSPFNQARFMRGFAALAEQQHWKYNLIEAFDQPWKRAHEGAAGGAWGIYNADRLEKPIFAGPVSNYPAWSLLFYLSAGIVVLTLLITTRHAAGVSGLQWLKFSITAAAGSILIVLQGYQFWIITRNPWESLWALLVLMQAAVVYLLVLSALVSNALPGYLNLAETMDLVRGRFMPATGSFPRQRPTGGQAPPQFLCSLISINRLAVLAFAMIAATGLLFDSRYRSFNNCGFILSALGYAWFFLKIGKMAQPGGLERLIALMLTFFGFGIFINETPLNWQADIWVVTCLLLAYPLWREGKNSSLRPLLHDGLVLAAAYAVLAVLRFVFLGSDMIDSFCTRNAIGIYSSIKLALGKLMYYQVFGLISLFLAGGAIWRGNLRLCLPALVASLVSLRFYNASMGSIAFVFVGLVLAHQRFAMGREGRGISM